MELSKIKRAVAFTEANFRGKYDGAAVASYIPELSLTNPDIFSFSAVTMEGELLSAGEKDVKFSMQSISKILLLALAIETLGADEVFSHVGREACSEAFNSVIKLELMSGKPLNPFINSGAIVISSLLAKKFGTDALEVVLDFAAKMGRTSDTETAPFCISEKIFLSEYENDSRNRSLAFFMESMGTLSCSVNDTLVLYFKSCSIEVTTEQTAAMGATVANGGVNPLTGKRVISLETSYALLGLMTVCGLYNESGTFAVQVGLPAKSGVSGGILCAVPGRMGICVYSPPLDASGNSAAGIKALSWFSNELKLRGV